MQASDPLASKSILTGATALKRFRDRVQALEAEVGAEASSGMLALVDDSSRSHDSLRDALSTRLMDCFRVDRNRTCFGLLYELNASHLLIQVGGRLRRYASKADPHDVLQEVFFNVYRYPHRFNAAREDAFRVWSAMIVRNTVLKHLRSQGRGGRQEVAFEDLSDQAEPTVQNPLSDVIEQEESDQCSQST